MDRDVETRVLLVAEMLDRAVEELKRLAAEIQTDTSTTEATSRERDHDRP